MDFLPQALALSRTTDAIKEYVGYAYYRLRGWDVNTGFQTRAKLEELELMDVAEDLVKRQLAR